MFIISTIMLLSLLLALVLSMCIHCRHTDISAEFSVHSCGYNILHPRYILTWIFALIHPFLLVSDVVCVLAPKISST
jgi:hypothetical protein